MAGLASVVGSNDGSAVKLLGLYIHLIELLRSFSHFSLFIFDGIKDSQIKPLFKLTVIEITSMDCIPEILFA